MKFVFVTVLIFCLIIFYIRHQQSHFENETAALFDAMKIGSKNAPDSLNEADLSHLPKGVQKWLIASKVIGKAKPNIGYLNQKVKMKLKPDQDNWMFGEASQITRLDKPQFIWQIKLNMYPLVHVLGRDQLKDGTGSMLIKPLGLFDAVNEHDNQAINEGAIHRYLAELMWFPSAALSEFIKWEAVNEHQVKATLNYKGMTVSGLFEFDDQGRVMSFYANRWRIEAGIAEMTGWRINVLSHQGEDHFPNKVQVIWELNDGDWKWLEVSIIGKN